MPVIDPLVLVRAVHFAATALAAGTVAFTALVAVPANGVEANAFSARARWLVWSALVAAIASGAVWLIWLASDLFGASLVNVCLHGGARTVLTETRFGQVWIARLALALLLAGLLFRPATRWLQLAVAAAFAGSLALIGHAGASPAGAGRVQLAADVIHLIASAAWLGALPALALLLHQARQIKGNTLVHAVVRRFSVAGIVSVAALIATGVINSWNLLSGPRDLVTTDYGRLLLLKIGLFAAMLGIASVNRFRLTPQLAAADTPAAARALERNTLAEIGLGLCVFLFVGALGTMAPPVHDHVHASQPVPADAAFTHIHTSEVMADVTIEPGRKGPAHASILLMREDFSIFTAKAVRILLTPQAPATVASISRNLFRLPDGGWRVDGLEIGQPGVWTVQLAIDPGNGREITLDAPIVIEP